MDKDHSHPGSVEAYIASFPKDVQVILRKIRATIRKAAPQATETIKYNIPTFTFMGMLVSYAAYKEHIGIYPAPAGDEKFNQKLSKYKSAKHTVRFPLDKPIPYGLIRQVVKLRAMKNLAKAKGKKKQPA
ncbi:MAG: DUF1801 domain-containing protein [Terriglobia bacterium]